MKKILRLSLILLCTIIFTAHFNLYGADTPTAWKPGYPEAGLNDAARQFVADFKEKAAGLKASHEKLRVLIIGDSLSDHYYTWSHHFRVAMQKAYGDGGLGNVNAHWALSPTGPIPGWLFSRETDLDASATGPWRRAFGRRGSGDVWPFLGWNTSTIASDSPESQVTYKARAANITVAYSTGSFISYPGKPVENTQGGFTIKVDDQSKEIAPAKAEQPLDIGLTKFECPQGLHTITLSGIHSGWLWLHGLLVENDTPGVVVYNISNGGWWPYNFLWRQPGFEKILKAMNPDYVIYYLSKPDSESLDASLSEQGKEPDYRHLVERISAALPNAKALHMICWDSRSGSNFQKDIDARKRRQAYFDETKAATLNLYEGLDHVKMGELKWYADKDEIHPSPTGGKAIGEAISALFLPGNTK